MVSSKKPFSHGKLEILADYANYLGEGKRYSAVSAEYVWNHKEIGGKRWKTVERKGLGKTGSTLILENT